MPAEVDGWFVAVDRGEQVVEHGLASHWGFGLYLASSGKYENQILPSGSPPEAPKKPSTALAASTSTTRLKAHDPEELPILTTKATRGVVLGDAAHLLAGYEGSGLIGRNFGHMQTYNSDLSASKGAANEMFIVTSADDPAGQAQL